MNSIISFKDVDISRSGYIQCIVIRDGEPADFYIRLPYSFLPEPDLLAATFVSLVGKAFEQIHLDLPLGYEQQKQLERWTGAQIIAHKGKDLSRKRTVRGALNFSGGFDSMAAWALLPEFDLVSLDFGGRFSRERKFFEQFNPYIFETNLVDIGLNKYSWTFMGIGSLLMRDELNLGYHSFGSIMAGTANTLVNQPIHQQDMGLFPAKYFEMDVANPVSGLSEIASMKLVAQTNPDRLFDILMSVALPREEKFVRKYQMLTAVLKEESFGLILPSVEKRPKGLEWGYSAATDLSSLYTMTVLGTEPVLDVYPNGVPQRFLDFAANNRMDFMNKLNPHAYEGADQSLVARWYSSLIQHGIYPFDRRDWSAMKEVIDLFQ